MEKNSKALRVTECDGECWPSQGRGVPKETGGRKRRGRGMNGTFSSKRFDPNTNLILPKAKKKPRYIAFTAICVGIAGLWKEFTIDVCRTPLLFGFQFS